MNRLTMPISRLMLAEKDDIFALSLLTFQPSLRICTVVKPKTDVKKETINSIILGEEVVELCNKVSQRNDFQSLRSLLVLRDGRECEGELEAILHC